MVSIFVLLLRLSQLVHQECSQVDFCFLLTCPHLIQSISLLSGSTTLSRLILYFPCPCPYPTISPRSPGSFQWAVILRNKMSSLILVISISPSTERFYFCYLRMEKAEQVCSYCAIMTFRPMHLYPVLLSLAQVYTLQGNRFQAERDTENIRGNQ